MLATRLVCFLSISERVSARLGRARAQGTRSGNLFGRTQSSFNRDEVTKLKQQGQSWRQIARECRVGATTVRRAYQLVAEVSDMPKHSE